MASSLNYYLGISKASWSPHNADTQHVNHYSIPNFDRGVPQQELAKNIKSNKFLISQPCILISKLNPEKPRIWLIEELLPGVSVCSTEFVVLIPKKIENLRYLYFQLKSDKVGSRLRETATGTSNSHQRVRPDAILEIEVPWIENEQQRTKAADFLWGIERKAQLNELISQTLESLSNSLYKHWFVDFEPVKARMAGEKPVGLDDSTAALFPDSMEDSEVGLIPKGWTVEKFGDANNLLMGQSPPGDTYNSRGEGLPFYQGRTDFGFRFPKQRIFCTQENRVALPGETLISVRAPVGDVNQAIDKCIIGRGIASAMHKSNSAAYTFALLKGLYPRLAYYNGEGTVFGAINRSDFSNLLIVEPSAALVERFETICGPMNEKIRSLFLSTEALTKLRDSLLPRLISGELQIPEEMLAS
jgi:type I restriction enzyme S subunit